MLSGVEYQSKEIDSLLDEMRLSLQKVEKSNYSTERKKKILMDINNLIQSVHTAQEAYLLELKLIKDEETKHYCTAHFDDRMTQLKNLTTEYEWKLNDMKRKQELLKLTSEKKEERENFFYNEAEEEEENNNNNSNNNTKLINMNREQLVMHGDKVQDKTQLSLNKIKDMVAEAEQIGVAVDEKLNTQTEQMRSIHEKMNDVEYNIKRAKNTIKTIAKNAVSDRCAQILCCLTFIFLILAITLIAIPK